MYISNDNMSIGGRLKKKKTSKVSKKKISKKIPIYREDREEPIKQLIGLPYDRKTHVKNLLKEIQDKIVRDIEKDDKYYYEDYTRTDFDRDFDEKRRFFSVLNVLSPEEIDAVYRDIQKIVRNSRTERSNVKGNLTRTEARRDALNGLLSAVDPVKFLNTNPQRRAYFGNDPVKYKYGIPKKLSVNGKTYLKDGLIDDIFDENDIYKTTGFSRNEINNLLEAVYKSFVDKDYIVNDTDEPYIRELEVEPIRDDDLGTLERGIINRLDDEVQLEMRAIPIEKELTANTKKFKFNIIKIRSSSKDEPAEGQGLFDNIKNIFTNTKSSALDNVQKKYYPLIITRVQIYRTPVDKVPVQLLKLISLGNFDYKSHFDELYHLYCVFELANESRSGFLYQLTEKTPNIVWEDRKNLLSTAKGAQSMIFNLPNNSQVRFGKMIDTLKANVGKALYQYSAAQNNCQLYILNLIKATCTEAGISVPSNLQSFIYQDLSPVLPSTSGTSKIADVVTSTAHVLNRVKSAVTGKSLIGLYNKAQYDKMRGDKEDDKDVNLKGSNLISRKEIINKRLASKIDSKIDKIL